MAHTSRDLTPVTGEQWRRLGFYHQLDMDQLTWSIWGTRAGLNGFARLLRRYAESAGADTRGEPFPVGPYGDLQIRLWDRPGIDDDSIYGNADDLKRLADLVEERLADAQPRSEIVIGTEYAADVEYSLGLQIMEDDFDPGTVVVERGDDYAVMTTTAQQLNFKFPGSESEGVIRLEDGAVVIQYERKDLAAVLGKVVDVFAGTKHSNIEDVVVPLSELSRVRFKRILFWAELRLQVQDLKLIERVPGVKGGVLRLHFRWSDRDDAEQLAATIDEMRTGENRGASVM